MKKQINILLLTILSITAVFAQDYTIRKEPEPFQEKIGLSIYYGGPDLWMSTTFQNQVRVFGATSTTYTPYGAGGIKFDYFLDRYFSLGLDAYYGYATKDSKVAQFDINGNINEFTISEQVQRYRVLLRGDVHFTDEYRIDPYLGFGIGVARTFYRADGIIPGAVDNFNREPGANPLAAKATLGVNFKVSKNFLFFGELAAGGPYAALGLQIRFDAKPLDSE